jgi:hypothetical protein
MPHLYAIAIGSNRPHGRHGRPPAWCRPPSPSSTGVHPVRCFAAAAQSGERRGGAGLRQRGGGVESPLEPRPCSPRSRRSSGRSGAAGQALGRAGARPRPARLGRRALVDRRLTIPHPALEQARVHAAPARRHRPALAAARRAHRPPARRAAWQAARKALTAPSRGPLAQSVEQLTFNQRVAGSSPARLTRLAATHSVRLAPPVPA